MARPGAGCGLEPGAFMSFKFAPRRIEDIRGQLVQSEVGNEGEMFAWIENHRMGVRAALAVRIDARSMVLDEVAGRRQGPIRPNRQHAHLSLIHISEPTR